ncbi:hypothetical protein JGH11_10585 [Dysgonomonas sp. Marseille-P4677]|uniref:hypothetical protein n=1 Tax=Dysgonomonas sp. Marseille-P4677 TaxID=2364790 RepID=UPI001912E179|nr:hypothetical protein [Dysgonomonas sp. Marseille-P4677]MBK5721318.1 hypothetical protein [Dysgonomonas sp. Marseille-P4677]
MIKKYVVARYFRGYYVQTMCEPKNKKDAELLCQSLSKEEGPSTAYKVEKIKSTKKKIKYL